MPLALPPPLLSANGLEFSGSGVRREHRQQRRPPRGGAEARPPACRTRPAAGHLAGQHGDHRPPPRPGPGTATTAMRGRPGPQLDPARHPGQQVGGEGAAVEARTGWPAACRPSCPAMVTAKLKPGRGRARESAPAGGRRCSARSAAPPRPSGSRPGWPAAGRRATRTATRGPRSRRTARVGPVPAAAAGSARHRAARRRPGGARPAPPDGRRRAWPTRACVDHHHSSSPIAASVMRQPGAAQRATARPRRRTAARTARRAASRPARRATRSGLVQACRAATAADARPTAAGRPDEASSAMSTAARSRTRRERSSAANALVTARLATHAEQSARRPRRPAPRPPRPAPNRIAAATTRPRRGRAAWPAPARRRTRPRACPATSVQRPQRQQREPGRVERLVHAEERAAAPAVQPSTSGRRRASGRHHVADVGAARRRWRASPSDAEHGEPAARTADRRRTATIRQRLAPEAVAHQPQLEPDEVRPGAAAGGSARRAVDRATATTAPAPVAVRPPTTSTKTSSRDRARRAPRSSVPTALMRAVGQDRHVGAEPLDHLHDVAGEDHRPATVDVPVQDVADQRGRDRVDRLERLVQHQQPRARAAARRPGRSSSSCRRSSRPPGCGRRRPGRARRAGPRARGVDLGRVHAAQQAGVREQFRRR